MKISYINEGVFDKYTTNKKEVDPVAVGKALAKKAIQEEAANLAIPFLTRVISTAIQQQLMSYYNYAHMFVAGCYQIPMTSGGREYVCHSYIQNLTCKPVNDDLWVLIPILPYNVFSKTCISLTPDQVGLINVAKIFSEQINSQTDELMKKLKMFSIILLSNFILINHNYQNQIDKIVEIIHWKK